MSNRTFVIGVGMTKFDKPGTKEGDYPDWAREAGEKALEDAGIDYEEVGQAYAGYCFGDSTYGQRALYELGLTGIPIVNVNNNCSTGSSALFLARQAVKYGVVDCALAIGFEKMEKGSLGMKYTDRTPAMDKHVGAMIAGRPGIDRRDRGTIGMAEQHAALKADGVEQSGQDVERLAVHIIERARQDDRRRGAIAGARIDEDAAAGRGGELFRKIAPQRGRPEAFMQHDDGRRVRRCRTDHAVFEIGSTDAQGAGGI